MIETERSFNRLPGAPVVSAPLIRRWLTNRWELWVVVAITGLAAVIGLWHLTTLPFGFHGDEANNTLEAQRIAQHGWVGPFSPLSGGYPNAINYFEAPFVKVLGAGVLGIRLPVAILGIAAIPLAYAVFRNVAGTRSAICGALLLTLSLWHIQLSRIGVPVTGWPTIELAALLCLQVGFKRRTWGWFAASGLLLGVSIWVYQTVIVSAGCVGIYLAGWLVVQAAQQRRTTLLRDALLIAILAACTLLGARPLISYARDPAHHYDQRFHNIYVFSQSRHDRCVDVPPEKRDEACRYAVVESLPERAQLVGKNIRRFYFRLVSSPTHYRDGIDGLGAQPPLGNVAAYLAMIGFVVALFRYRRDPVVLIGGMSIVGLLVAAGLVLDGQYRRTLGMLPFVSMFGGIALGTMWEWADRQRWIMRLPSIALVIACIAWPGFDALRFYFGGDLQNNSNTRFVFRPEQREAWEYLDGLGHPYVYLYANLVSLHYEARRVLAPDIAGGEDRSMEFTSEDKTSPLRYDLKPSVKPSDPDTGQPDGAVFLFLGSYVDGAEEASSKYPGGALGGVYNERLKLWDYRAYYLPQELLRMYEQQESITYATVTP